MQFTTNLTLGVRTLVTFLVVSMAGALFASDTTTVITTIRLPDADNYAVGQLLNSSGVMVADWTLNTSVSGTDFSNYALTGGTKGLQYTFINEVQGSADVNTIAFDVTPVNSSDSVNITLLQSPYFGTPGTWNGGNTDIAQFSVSWAGGGMATVIDPDNQIAGLSTGSMFSSGTTVVFSSNQILNTDDSWGIELPQGVASVVVGWSSSNPSPNSDLTREWLTFDANVVPEPASGAILGIGFTFLLGFFRRKNR